jgi:hypothetical protein
MVTELVRADQRARDDEGRKANNSLYLSRALAQESKQADMSETLL